eukprot:TRINITY_DN12963_c1_g1_i2.p1 TRINITY_DN12963_c1_g1~~TRINITY_DN12963_c1_g1_i2.p1  ORF type:complete len:253 (+),score=53.74 TRINITY_DN12963_c1_g1_i2:100-759(+)
MVVKDVATWEESKPWVSVNFAQTARFSMFVSSEGSRLSAVAVEAAACEAPLSVDCRFTFLDCFESSDVQESVKAASAPAALELNAVGSSSEANDAESNLSHHSPQTATSTSISEAYESQEVEAHLKIGTDFDRVRLSDFLEVFQCGAPSLGSMAHASGRCRPCRFQVRHQKAPEAHRPCTSGVLCGSCHEQHSEEYVRWTRNTSSSMRRKKDRKDVVAL